MRILHVLQTVSPAQRPYTHDLDPGSDAAMFACADVVATFSDLRHEFCLIGGTYAEVRAEMAGVHTTTRLAPPGGRSVLGWQAFRRLLRDHGEPDLIHCWTPASLPIAILASKRSPPVVASGFGPPPRWAGRMLGRVNSAILLSSDDSKVWAPNGDGRCPVTQARPNPAESTDAGRHRQAAARISQGLPEGGVGVVLLGDPPSVADAHRFAFVLGLLNVAGIDAWGVVPDGSGALLRARRLLGRAGPLAPLLFECAAPIGPPQIDACDFAFAFTPTQGRAGAIAWQIAMAHARGVPTVGPQALQRLGLHDPTLASRCLARVDLSSELALRLIDLASNQDSHSTNGPSIHTESMDPAENRPTHTDAVAEAWTNASGRPVRPRVTVAKEDAT